MKISLYAQLIHDNALVSRLAAVKVNVMSSISHPDKFITDPIPD